MLLKRFVQFTSIITNNPELGKHVNCYRTLEGIFNKSITSNKRLQLSIFTEIKFFIFMKLKNVVLRLRNCQYFFK